MLTSLRKGAAGWIAKIFIGLLVLSFAVWGIADIFGGFGSGTVATVGDTTLTAADYQTAYQDELQRLSIQFGRRITSEQARMLGIEQRTLSTLTGRAAIDEHARRLKLGLGDKALAERVRRNPSFKGPDGKFSRVVFNELLGRVGLSEGGYIARERGATIRSQITTALAASVRPPDTLIEALNQYRNETRKIAFYTIPIEKAGEVAKPDDAALKAYFEDHKPDFTAPEYRKLDLLLALFDDIKGRIEVSEEDLRQDYEAQAKHFTTPERRHVYQISFPDKASAAKAHEKLDKGAKFLDVAKAAGVSAKDADLGKMARADFVDPKIAEAAFSLEKGSYSQPIDGGLTTAIVRVTEIEPEKKRSFEEVKDEIRSRFQSERAKSEILDLHDKVEDERAGGATLEEIAAKLGLKRRVIKAVDRSGKSPDGKPVKDLPGSAAVLRTAFNSDVGVENDPVDLAGGGFAWIDVVDVIASALKPFESVRDEVEKAYLADARQRALSKIAKAAVEKIEAGAAITGFAKQAGAKVVTTGGLKRSERSDGLPAAAVAQAFALAKGRAGTTKAEKGLGRIVFEVVDVEPAKPVSGEDRKKLETELAGLVSGDLLVEYVSALGREFPVRINQANFRRVTGADVR